MGGRSIRGYGDIAGRGSPPVPLRRSPGRVGRSVRASGSHPVAGRAARGGLGLRRSARLPQGACAVLAKIGRASCRERVWSGGGSGAVKRKTERKGREGR